MGAINEDLSGALLPNDRDSSVWTRILKRKLVDETYFKLRAPPKTADPMLAMDEVAFGSARQTTRKSGPSLFVNSLK